METCIGQVFPWRLMLTMDYSMIQTRLPMTYYVSAGPAASKAGGGQMVGCGARRRQRGSKSTRRRNAYLVFQDGRQHSPREGPKRSILDGFAVDLRSSSGLMNLAVDRQLGEPSRWNLLASTVACVFHTIHASHRRKKKLVFADHGMEMAVWSCIDYGV